LLINHHIHIVKASSSMLFLVTEHLLLVLVRNTNIAVVSLVIFVACLAPVVASMHGYVLAPFLEVLRLLDFIINTGMHVFFV